MSIFTARIQKPIFYTNDSYSLTIRQSEKLTIIVMSSASIVVNTKYLPKTFALLKKSLPSIFRSKCFNENNYPFSKEVRRTELGHLFEHILLEYLSDLAREKGVERSVYSGITSWNWKKDARGVFHIIVNAGIADADIFLHALKKTTELFGMILQTRARKVRTN